MTKNKAVKGRTLHGWIHIFFQLGSRNHQRAEELKSNADGDARSTYTSRDTEKI